MSSHQAGPQREPAVLLGAHRVADTTVTVQAAVLSLAAPGATRRPPPWICPVARAWGALLSVLRLPNPQNFWSHHHSSPHCL